MMVLFCCSVTQRLRARELGQVQQRQHPAIPEREGRLQADEERDRERSQLVRQRDVAGVELCQRGPQPENPGDHRRQEQTPDPPVQGNHFINWLSVDNKK